MFFASNFFYAYQFNTFNLPNFNIRTRSLNNSIYWLAEICGGYLSGYLLDHPRIRKSLRARLALGALLLLTGCIWTLAYLWEWEVAGRQGVDKIDFSNSRYALSALLYSAFGFLAASYNSYLMWYETSPIQ